MSSGRPSIRVHREDVDDAEFHPRAPARVHDPGMAPAAHQCDHIAAPKEIKHLKKVFDVDADSPTWDQELEKPSAGDLFPHGHVEAERTLATDIDDTFEMNSGLQDDEVKLTQHLTRSGYPVNTDWSEQEELVRSAQSSADMAHAEWTQRESRVGAVHVPGETAVGVASSRDDGTASVLSEIPEQLVAEAVASDALAIEIRNDLLYELREEMQRHHVVAAVQGDSQDRAAPPFWTKKRSRVALLLLLFIVFIVGVVVGALAAPGTFENDNCNEVSSESFDSMGSILLSDKFTGRDEQDRFGSVVMISRDGTRMAVGAEQGSYARVFQLVGKHWKPKGEPKVIDTYTVGDQFGRCVALNREGSILAVGGWNNDAAGENAGHVKVLWHNGTHWLPMGSDLLGDVAGDRFGWYVSLSDDGRTLAVGAKEGDPSGKGDAGYVRVFTYSGNLTYYGNMSEWEQLGSDLAGENTDDEFGKSVSLSENGKRLAVGAGTALGERGMIQVFDFDGDLNKWQVVGQALKGDSAKEWLGGAISLSADGSSLAASASGTEKEKGSVLVWELKDSNWTQKGKRLNGEVEGDQFGGSWLSLSGNGNCLAVGATHYSTDRGKAYLYRWDNSQWKEIATVHGNIPGGRLGHSVALSGDCKQFAVGAMEYDNQGVAPKGSSSNGYALVYEVLSE